ncbi:MoaD/ThiS family protein [Prosthecobacter dejongeii]|uniref:Molybdopterin synthase sulfur carrier subunit n=1 Tax=Prosthecobacter dejongeii TaxID=48465 RepID=A0A7W7YMY7_9BACT|nr:MoaD/ThiS family protein [Prosthecobacter dejongeii]MBB5039145.1 molybdopterin converting factor small subunit [Prosthecobacter dejongeii]
MITRVLFFSVLRDITGHEEITWQMPEGASVADLLDSLYRRWPKLEDWDSSLLVAVDLTYVKKTELLHPQCEVALMPPVQGG